eukprot:gene23261-16870_t
MIPLILSCSDASLHCVAVGDILEPIRKLDGAPHWLRAEGGRRIVMGAFWLVFMLPLSLLRSVSSLQFSSFLGVAAILFLIFATVYHCSRKRFADDWDCDHIPHNHEMLDDSGSLLDSSLPCTSPVEYVKFNVGTVSSLPLVMFAFSCQVNMLRVSWLGMVGLCFSIYACMGIFGYLDFRADVDGNILRNLQQPGLQVLVAFYPLPSDVRHDGVIATAFVAITLTVVVAFPLVVFPCRESIFHILNAPATDAERDRIITEAQDPRTSEETQRKYVVGPAARIRRSHSCPSLHNWDSRLQNSPRPDGNNSPGAQSLPIGGRAVTWLSNSPGRQSGPFNTPQLVGTPAGPTPPCGPRGGSFQTMPPLSIGPAAENYYVPPQPTRVYKRPEAWRHYLVSLAISGSALVIAILIPNIEVVFSFLGGVCSSFLCFILPAWFVRRLRADGDEDMPTSLLDKVATELLFWGGIGAGLLSTGVTIYSQVTGK